MDDLKSQTDDRKFESVDITLRVMLSSKRSAFTLVELLVTVAVIAILASLLLGALYSAQDSARAQKTRSTIAKLHTMMTQRWESYKTRRVPITVPAGTRPADAALMRLTAIRELMRLELPDRNSDILVGQPAAGLNLTRFTSIGSTGATVDVPWPSLNAAYRRKLGAPTPADTQFQAAECLFIILTTSIDDDTEGVERFGDSEIGDKDGDGRREFKDAWGNPISWVRWPAGFVSELQNSDPVVNHDPFDPRRVQAGAYALFPLIFSPGPDAEYEIRSLLQDGAGDELNYLGTKVKDMPGTTGNPKSGIMDPYAFTPLLGSANDQDGDGVNDSVDNIHNHLIGSR